MGIVICGRARKREGGTTVSDDSNKPRATSNANVGELPHDRASTATSAAKTRTVDCQHSPRSWRGQRDGATRSCWCWRTVTERTVTLGPANSNRLKSGPAPRKRNFREGVRLAIRCPAASRTAGRQSAYGSCTEELLHLGPRSCLGGASETWVTSWSSIYNAARGNSNPRIRPHNSLRRIGTSTGASIPSRTTLPFMLITVMVIPPPMTMDSPFFLDKTSIFQPSMMRSRSKSD